MLLEQRSSRRIVSQLECSIRYLPDHRAIFTACFLFYVGPLFIRHKFCPPVPHRRGIWPFKEINKLGAVVFSGFPDCYYLEIILCHYTSGMIPKPFVKGFLVAVKYLVNAELMNGIW